MKTAPTLLTNRLSLGDITVADIPSIVRYAGNKKVAENTLNLPHPYHGKHAVFWINLAHEGWQDQSKSIFGIRLKSTQELIGGVGLHINARFNQAEMGYWIGLPFWNNGYMSEAVQAVIQYGFEVVHLNKIHAHHLVGNPASGKVMLKNGMIKEGVRKEHTRRNGVYGDVALYGLTKGDYVRTI